MQKDKITPFLPVMDKYQLRIDKGLNIRAETVKPPEENREKASRHKFGNDVMTMSKHRQMCEVVVLYLL